jgi:CheY-like chemotaxis protein
MLLRAYGIDALTATDGVGALACVSGRRVEPDVLIMDFNLPGEMDGTEAAEEICRALGHVVPTIFLSGELSNAALPWLPGAPLLFVAKPVDAELLVKVVESFAALGRIIRSRPSQAAGVRRTARSDARYFFSVQELHQPVALTALPGNSRQPPSAEPAAPW